MSRTKSVLKNVGASALPQLVNILTNLIVPIMIIGIYGSELNGLISTSKSIVSYISLVGAGIATAVTQALFLPVANKDAVRVRGMLLSANRMFNRCGVIFCIILVAVAFLYPLVIRSDIDYITTALLILVVGLSGASEFFVVGKCRALLYADQKVYVSSLIQAASLLLALGAAVLMMKLGAGIVWVQFAISLVYVFRAVFLQLYVIKKYPEYASLRGVAPVDEAIAKKNDAMLHQLTGLAVTSSQPIILTTLVGLDAASVYSVYSVVFFGLISICSNVNTAIMPFLGRSYAKDNVETQRVKYSLAELAFCFITVWVFSISALMIIPFVRLYTAGSDINYVYLSFAMLFVCMAAFNVVRLPASSMINVAGHFKQTRTRAIIEAVLCVCISTALTLTVGMDGVLWGTGIALCWRMLDMIIYVNRRILSTSVIRPVIRLIVSFAIIGVAVFVACRLDLAAGSYSQWILKALAAAGIVTAVCAVALVPEIGFLRKCKAQLAAGGTDAKEAEA